ncbi:MAG: tRNA lysidine(34) synthetase TilS, partial [Dehalococcoidia bacterium]
LLRGSGLYGQRGMQPLSLWQGPDGSRVTLLRPLLELSRQETEAYCRHLGLAPRFDTSNRSLSLVRNRLRRDLLPRLQGYNPRVKEALRRLAGIAAREVEFLQSEAARVWPTLSRRQGEARVLDTLRVRALHPGLWRHVLRRAYEEVAGSAQGLEEVHLEAMVGLLEGPPGRSLHLPGGVTLVTGYGQLTLGRGSLEECPLPALAGPHRLKVPGMTALPGWWVTAVVAPPPAELPTDPLTACLDPQAVGAGLLVRARRPGDRFQPLGMEESKKLQDFFVDQKVPRTWRGRVPLVLAEGGIVWVVGYRIAHWARLPQGARQALVLRFRQEG